ncbi:Trimethylguanosine synthase [Yarrowia sp. C11]|nr:Trimethylguanosine synthase [Yarrowia sp. E02]KAG5371515.1 Trimethylguanosine synthase [Yarrowia sp. C11]
MAKKTRKTGISGVAAFLNSAKEEEQRFKRQKLERSDSDTDGPEEDSIHGPIRGKLEGDDNDGSDNNDSESDSKSSTKGNGKAKKSSSDSSSSSSSDSDSSSKSNSSIYLTTLPPALPDDSEQLFPVDEHPSSDPNYSSTFHQPYWPDYSSLPSSLSKYYSQRHFLFAKFDEGVLLNNTQWFSTTPELVAEQVAQHIWTRFPDPSTVIMDAFGGAGGNAIQLAHYYDHIICVDIDKDSISCAKQNAWVYGVSEKIEFVVGNCMEVLSREAYQEITDVIFASPPWGGPDYKSHGGLFDLLKMEPLDLKTIHTEFSKITKNLCYFLPKNSNLQQMQEVCGEITTLVDVNTGKNRFPALWPLQQKWAATVDREQLGLEAAVKQKNVCVDVSEEDLGESNEGTTLTYNYIYGMLKGCMVYLGGLA